MKQILLSALLFNAILVFAQIPTDNLQLHIPFNGNANDVSGNSNDGQFFGPIMANDRFGNPASAIFMDGLDDYMLVLHDATLNFNGQSDDYSLSIWVNSDSPKLGANSYRIIEKRFTGQSSEGYPLSISGATNTAGDYDANFHVYDGITGFTHNGGSGIWHGWHHLVAVVDNSVDHELRVYIDAELQGSMPLALAATGANAGNIVFGNNYSFVRPYHGEMDDIRMYSDVLSECEIYSLYMEDNPNNNEIETVTICAGEDYTYPDGSVSTNITTTEVHTSELVAITGCDSVSIETTVEVTTVVASLTTDADSLIATVDSASYQWMDCDLFASVAGANEQIYEPSATGNYAVIITQDGCADTSSCAFVEPSSVEELTSVLEVSLYPNPNNGTFTMNSSSQGNFEIVDMLGKVVQVGEIFHGTKEIQVDLQEGVYFTRFTSSEGMNTTTIRMVIKN